MMEPEEGEEERQAINPGSGEGRWKEKKHAFDVRSGESRRAQGGDLRGMNGEAGIWDSI